MDEKEKIVPVVFFFRNMSLKRGGMETAVHFKGDQETTTLIHIMAQRKHLYIIFFSIS